MDLKHQANKIIHQSESIAQMVENHPFRGEEKIRLSILEVFISFTTNLIVTVRQNQTMKSHHLIATSALALLLCGCASTEYKTFEGKNTVFDGQGGTRTTIDGIDFWENGEPPRKFRLIGIIEDERPGGLIPMARLKGDIAKKAKEQGADAVIILGSGSKVCGYVTNASATTTLSGNSAYSSGAAFSAPIVRNSASFAVVKYIE